jgi:hypothetical protein
VFHELDAVVGQLGGPKFMARTAWLRNHRPNRVRVAKKNEPFRTGMLGVDEWTQVRLVGV